MELNIMLNSNNNTQIDETPTCILINGEKSFVLRHNKSVYQFWQNEEISILKKDAVKTNGTWEQRNLE